MIRRTLRYGIRLGFIGGLGFALFRLFDARRAKQSPGAGYTPPASAPARHRDAATPEATNVAPASFGLGSASAEPPQADLVDPVMLTSVSEAPRKAGNSKSDNGLGALGSAPPSARTAPVAKKPSAPKPSAPKPTAPKAAAPKPAAPKQMGPTKAAAKKAPPKPSKPPKPRNRPV